MKPPTPLAQIATAIRVITRVDPSPLNCFHDLSQATEGKRWKITLKCGHRFWSTSARKPRVGSKAYCADCRFALNKEAANVGPV